MDRRNTCAQRVTRRVPSFHPSTKLAAAALLTASALLPPSTTRAASQTWLGTTNASWTTASNWSGNAVPGINPTANSTNTTDVATFNAPLNGTIGGATNPIVVDGSGNTSSNRMIGRLVFDTANVGSYFIGADNTTTLLFGNNQTAISLTAAVPTAQTINAPIALHLPSSTNGAATITNDATSTAATLTLAGGIMNSPNSSRGTVWTLTGANTGNNTISGNLSLTNTGGVASALIKSGAGTWVLSGSNTIAGGTTINSGLLVAGSNQALGSGTNAVNISGGTLEISNGLSLSNNTVTLNSGTLRSNGTSTVNALAVGAAATDVTLATVNASDVFTLGTAATSVTGGSANSTIHVTGPGQLLLNNAATYGGNWSFEGGTTTINNASALGTTAAGVTVSVGSTGKLQLNSQSVTVGKLSSAGTAGVIENGGSGNSTLTLNSAASNVFGATLQDGAGGGNLALVKSGFGTLTLSGASTYSGGTTVNAGSLLATNTTGSATGSGPVAINNLATLAGTGTLAGAVTLNSGATLSPGISGVGTLTVGSLDLESGSALAWDINSTSSLDKVAVTNSGGLTLNGGSFVINGGTSPFTTNGVYNLIGYSGSINGDVANLSVDPSSKNASTNTYTFGTAGGFVTLTVANGGGAVSYWNTDSNSTWLAGPWTTATAPNTAGAFASFGGGGTPITANRTVTVAAPITVGTIAFNNPSFSFTLANGGGSITLDNAGSGAFITDSAGSHAVQVPVAMTAQGATLTVTNAADTLTVSGDVSGPGATLTKSGPGTLALTGNNTYTGGTNLKGGVTQINSAASLGDPAGSLTFNGGSLQLLADLASARNYVVNGLSDAVIDTNGHSLTLTGGISPTSGAVGGVVKNGAGVLALNGTNSYTGPTTVNAGTLSINSNASLGDPAAGAALNLGSGTTLAVTGNATLNNGATGTNDRAVTVGAAGATVDVAAATTLSITGALSGGVISKVDAGTLSVNSSASTLAGYDVSAGTLNAGSVTAANGGGLGSAVPVTLRGGATLTSSASQSNTFSFNNPLTVPAGQIGNINTPIRFNWTGGVTGAGTINVTVNSNANRFDLSNDFTNFTGTLSLGGPGTGRFLINGGGFNGAGMAGTTLVLNDSVILNPSSNSTGNTITIGALSGSSATAGFGTQTQGGGINYVVGGLGTDTTFGGFIQGAATLTKNGTGALVLTGTQNTFAGSTNTAGGVIESGGAVVNAGTLRLAVDNALPTSSPNVVNTGGTLEVAGVNQTMASLAGTGGTVLLSGPATLNLNGGTNTSFAGSIVGAGATLNKSGGGVQTVGNVDLGTVNTSARLVLAGPNPSRILSVGDGSLIQLGGSLVLPNMTQADATSRVISGYNTGTWDGSSGFLATPDGLHGLAVTSVSTLGTAAFPTLSGLTGAETLVANAFYGDLNLDGKVNADDYARIDRGAALGLSGWVNGDLNYDGVVNSDDYLRMDTTYIAGGVPHDAVAALFAEREAQFGDAYVAALTAAVPEPTSLAACGLALLPLLSRRRRAAR